MVIWQPCYLSISGWEFKIKTGYCQTAAHWQPTRELRYQTSCPFSNCLVEVQNPSLTAPCNPTGFVGVGSYGSGARRNFPALADVMQSENHFLLASAASRSALSKGVYLAQIEENITISFFQEIKTNLCKSIWNLYERIWDISVWTAQKATVVLELLFISGLG